MKSAEYYPGTDDSSPLKRRETIASFSSDPRPDRSNIEDGVVSAPLSKYLHCQTRICRPVGLSEADCEKGCRYASAHSSRLRFQERHRPLALSVTTAHDAALAPPIDRARVRRCQPYHLLFADCASIRRHALPDFAQDNAFRQPDGVPRGRRNPPLALYAPRDFDISPYFTVVKPKL